MNTREATSHYEETIKKKIQIDAMQWDLIDEWILPIYPIYSKQLYSIVTWSQRIFGSVYFRPLDFVGIEI